jgi:hypothetical protein
MGIQLGALLRQFEAACTAADDLTEAAIAHFEQHPDAEIITSFPGLGMLAGARVLAEIGDDRSRFADARGLKMSRRTPANRFARTSDFGSLCTQLTAQPRLDPSNPSTQRCPGRLRWQLPAPESGFQHSF